MLALLATAASDCGRANRTWCSTCSVSFSAYGDTGSGPFGVVGAGTFIYDLAAGRFRYDTWSGDQNISAIFVCNPPFAARALPNFTCATYTVDWQASSCVAAPTPMAIPLFALPGDASLTQSSKTENVELWSAKVTGASRVDYTVDSQSCLPLRQTAYMESFFPPIDNVIGFTEYTKIDMTRPAASAFDPKAIGAPPCTQAGSDAVAGALLASGYF